MTSRLFLCSLFAFAAACGGLKVDHDPDGTDAPAPDAGPHATDGGTDAGPRPTDAGNADVADTEPPLDARANDTDAEIDGVAIAPITPAALVPPGATLAIWTAADDQELFAVGADGATWSCSGRDPRAATGAWSAPRKLSAAGLFVPGTPVIVTQRQPGMADLFLAGKDGAFWNGGWHDSVVPKHWEPGYAIGPAGTLDMHASVIAFSRSQNETELAALGIEGALWTTGWPAPGENRWTSPRIALRPAGLAGSAALAFLTSAGGAIDLFAVDSQGDTLGVGHEEAGSPWAEGAHVPTIDEKLPVGVPLRAAARTPNDRDLFVVGQSGDIWNAGWRSGANPWQPGYRVSAGGLFPPGANVAAISRTATCTDLFAVGKDGALYVGGSSDLAVDGGQWTAAIPITRRGSFPPGAAIAATSRTTDSVDLFVAASDGAVWSATWKSHR